MSDQATIRIANLKMSVNVFFRTVFSAALSIILYMSLLMVVTGLSTKTIGIRTFEFDVSNPEGTTRIITEEYYDQTTTQPDVTTTTASGTSTTAANEGDTTAATGGSQTTQTTATDLTTESTTEQTLPTNQRQEWIRTEIPATTQWIFDIVAQILMLIMLLSLPYAKLWAQGDKDSNAVHFGHMAEDKLRGLKVGLIAGIPSFVVYFLLLLSKLGVILPKFIYTYRLMNFCFLPVINRITGNGTATVTADISWLSMLLLLVTVALVPLTCWLAYLLGYKHISVSEKVIYINPNRKKKRRS